jgi:ubiquinone/menaquinone biosynthesis C-methylase UbiE
MTMSQRFRIPEMEGRTARWYARQRGTESQLRENGRQAGRLTEGLPAGAAILEVAPGPGYFAVELAKRGYQVAGLDISRTMVQIATEHARRAGAAVDFRLGDATELPFDADSFDLVVCQAAFKNFRHPVKALDEMHRVLRPGGTAVIQDLNREATRADIAGDVRAMRLSAPNAAITRLTLGWLRRRAHPAAEFRRLAAQSEFGGGEISTDGLGLEVRLRA